MQYRKVDLVEIGLIENVLSITYYIWSIGRATLNFRFLS